MMNEENEKALNDAFPHLLGFLLRVWHFNKVPDGWFKLVFDLFTDIESEASRIGLHPKDKGWPMLIDIEQQRDGSLYVWIGDTTPEMDVMIKNAAAKSLSICEECGLLGECIEIGNTHRMFCKSCIKNVWGYESWSRKK